MEWENWYLRIEYVYFWCSKRYKVFLCVRYDLSENLVKNWKNLIYWLLLLRLDKYWLIEIDDVLGWVILD